MSGFPWTSPTTSSDALPRCSTTPSRVSKGPSARWRGSPATSRTAPHAARTDRREHIFDRFYRGANHGLRDGAGLGLNIAKWTVEANLGQLAYEPRTTGGSTFRITLPAA